MKRVWIFFVFFLIISCKSKNTSVSDTKEYSKAYILKQEEQADRSDENNYHGTYCAEVEYYNPNIGFRNVYELNVEVKEGYLKKIIWPNGGWLDESHFKSQKVVDGECSFTSDRGYQYTVTLEKKGVGWNN